MASWFRIRIAAIALVVYGLLVIAATLTPVAPDRPISGLLRRLISAAHNHGVPRFIDYGLIEFTANIAMFIPLTLIVAWLLPRHLWWAAAIVGSWSSFAIESAQHFLLPGRFASVLDILSNSLGSLLGALIARAVRSAVVHRDALIRADLSSGSRVLRP